MPSISICLTCSRVYTDNWKDSDIQTCGVGYHDFDSVSVRVLPRQTLEPARPAAGVPLAGTQLQVDDDEPEITVFSKGSWSCFARNIPLMPPPPPPPPPLLDLILNGGVPPPPPPPVPGALPPGVVVINNNHDPTPDPPVPPPDPPSHQELDQATVDTGTLPHVLETPGYHPLQTIPVSQLTPLGPDEPFPSTPALPVSADPPSQTPNPHPLSVSTLPPNAEVMQETTADTILRQPTSPPNSHPQTRRPYPDSATQIQDDLNMLLNRQDLSVNLNGPAALPPIYPNIIPPLPPPIPGIMGGIQPPLPPPIPDIMGGIQPPLPPPIPDIMGGIQPPLPPPIPGIIGGIQPPLPPPAQVHPFPSPIELEPPSACGYAIHSACWDLMSKVLPRNEDLHAPILDICLCLPGCRNGSSCRLDWGHQYGLTSYMDPPFSPKPWENWTLVDRAFREFRQGRRDPLQIDDLKAIIEKLQSKDGEPRRRKLNFYCKKGKISPIEDLPMEVSYLILQLLPSKDVLSLKLASSVFASLPLSESFWSSRFRHPHEYEHIFEATEVPAQRFGGNWRRLYFKVRDLEKSEKSKCNLLNRRRIWDLLNHIREMLPDEDERILHGQNASKGKGRIGTSNLDDLKDVKFRKGHDLTWGKSILRARKLSLPKSISSLTVSFVKWNGTHYIAGLNFTDGKGESTNFGYTRKYNTVTISASDVDPASATFKLDHFIIAMDWSGIRSIAFVSSSGQTSRWIGHHRDIPKQRIGAKEESSQDWLGKFDVSAQVLVVRD
jgi:hypothetical protein